jgi:hypothetical protein
MDRTLHSPRDVAATLDVPVIGTIPEIRSPRQLRRQRMWATLGRPAMVLIFLALALGSAVICYSRLADPGYGKSSQQPAVISMFSATGGER